ncbi:flowering locus K homology domain-like [Impatiens glandulifera]|uniref:flowering locus K homology domain-like n=1 Tax=Impatiens glandulifera TaxID=253017 RepID=UPI001FB170D5|nr:flowering locus K homology domain-like [Impatiens glandulifera]
MDEENFEEQVTSEMPEDPDPLETDEENFDEQVTREIPEYPNPLETDEENFDEQVTSEIPEDPNPLETDEENFDEQVTSEMPEDPNPLETDGIPEETISPETQDSEKDLAVEVQRWPGWPGENIFRMLVPTSKVGSLIGRKGEFIKKMSEETKARIKILDGPSCNMERAVLVSAKEEPSLTLSPAMEGLLAVHAHIVDLNSDQPQPGKVSTRLLVASIQAGILIGKQGATVNSIQDESDCTIRVLSGENLPTFALSDDSVVDIQGEPQNVHKAVELIITHLRKFLVDRSIVQVFETQMQMPNARAAQNMPPSWGASPQGFLNNAGAGPGYMHSDPPYRPPPRKYDNYYPLADMPPPDNHPRQGPLSYGRDGLMGVSTPSAQPQQSFISKVGQTMQISLSYADAVIGTSGATISYIRRASGATIAIQEMGGGVGEMTVEINGSASQVQAAQQLIQNVIADVSTAAAPQIPAAAAPTGQAYPNYPSYDNAAPPPDYSYGTHYGY